MDITPKNLLSKIPHSPKEISEVILDWRTIIISTIILIVLSIIFHTYVFLNYLNARPTVSQNNVEQVNTIDRDKLKSVITNQENIMSLDGSDIAKDQNLFDPAQAYLSTAAKK